MKIEIINTTSQSVNCNEERVIPVEKCSEEKNMFNNDSQEVQKVQILQLGHVHPV